METTRWTFIRWYDFYQPIGGRQFPFVDAHLTPKGTWWFSPTLNCETWIHKRSADVLKNARSASLWLESIGSSNRTHFWLRCGQRNRPHYWPADLHWRFWLAPVGATFLYTNGRLCSVVIDWQNSRNKRKGVILQMFVNIHLVHTRRFHVDFMFYILYKRAETYLWLVIPMTFLTPMNR